MAKRELTPITEEDINALRGILGNLKQQAQQAQEQGNLTTFRVYQRLIKTVSPEVLKAQARMERESAARINKAAEAMKKRQTPPASQQQ